MPDNQEAQIEEEEKEEEDNDIAINRVREPIDEESSSSAEANFSAAT